MFNIEIIGAIAIFAGFQTLNVILNSLKTLIMAKTNNPHMSAGINALTFGFYTLIVNYIANMPLEITIPVTVITNVIGVYITYAIFNKAKRDSLWKIEVYAHLTGTLLKKLEAQNIGHFAVTPNVVQIYCYKQAETAIVKKWIDENADNGVKYNITEITKKF
jgi:hypothetical protein